MYVGILRPAIVLFPQCVGTSFEEADEIGCGGRSSRFSPCESSGPECHCDFSLDEVGSYARMCNELDFV